MTEREPIHRIARNSLRADIESGALAGQLPSMDKLAKKYDVSRVTIRNAMQYLQTEGLLTIRQGRGSFVNVPKESQESGTGHFRNEISDTFDKAVTHYAGFLINPNIPEDVKVRMIGIIDAQLGLVEQLQQPRM